MNDVTAGVHIEPIVAIPNHGRVTKQFHGYLTRVPSDIIQLTGLKRTEVFLSGKGSTGGINQLEIFAMQAASRIEVDVNKGAEPLALDPANMLGLRAIGSRCRATYQYAARKD